MTSAPTMLPARILWPHVVEVMRQQYIMAALTLMTRDELASLDRDWTFEDLASWYAGCTTWELLPAPLRRRLLQFLHGEDSKAAARR